MERIEKGMKEWKIAIERKEIESMSRREGREEAEFGRYSLASVNPIS